MSLGVRDHPCKKCIHICPAKAGQATGRSSAWLLFKTLPQLHLLTVGARAFFQSSFQFLLSAKSCSLFRLYPPVAHSCTVLLMPHLSLHALPPSPHPPRTVHALFVIYRALVPCPSFSPRPSSAVTRSQQPFVFRVHLLRGTPALNDGAGVCNLERRQSVGPSLPRSARGFKELISLVAFSKERSRSRAVRGCAASATQTLAAQLA
jgi:hypothetical protein